MTLVGKISEAVDGLKTLDIEYMIVCLTYQAKRQETLEALEQRCPARPDPRQNLTSRDALFLA